MFLFESEGVVIHTKKQTAPNGAVCFENTLG